MKTATDFRNECLVGEVISCTADYLHDNWLVTKDLANIWWDLSRDEKEVTADYVITEWATYNFRYYKSSDGTWKNAMCLIDAMIRFLKIGDGERYENEMASCYWSQDKIVEHPYYEECFGLPVYLCIVGTVETGAGFTHAICALQMNQNILKMNNWRFFQYTDTDIKPGHSQMPCADGDKHVQVYVQDITHISCWSYGGGRIVTWKLNPDCTIQPNDICSWITSIGGKNNTSAMNITDAILGYKGVENLGFTVAAAHISGLILYYKGQMSAGDSLTGCSG